MHQGMSDGLGCLELRKLRYRPRHCALAWRWHNSGPRIFSRYGNCNTGLARSRRPARNRLLDSGKMTRLRCESFLLDHIADTILLKGQYSCATVRLYGVNALIRFYLPRSGTLFTQFSPTSNLSRENLMYLQYQRIHKPTSSMCILQYLTAKEQHETATFYICTVYRSAI